VMDYQGTGGTDCIFLEEGERVSVAVLVIKGESREALEGMPLGGRFGKFLSC